MKIDFLEFGEKGKPIIFLHGWQQDKRSLMTLVPFLFKNNKLYFLDLPGFGKSNLPKGILSSFDYVREVVSWIKEQKLSNVSLVGHSFGGKIAAIITKSDPELISHLVLIAASGIPHPKFWYKFNNFIPKYFRDHLKTLFVSKDYREAGALLPVFKTIIKEDLRDLLSEINRPTLIIWGKDDKELPSTDGEKMMTLIKNSSLKIIEGDHFPFISNPKEVATLIDRFVNNE